MIYFILFILGADNVPYSPKVAVFLMNNLIFLYILGYSIFVVEGSLPPSEADETLRLHPAIPTAKPRLLTEVCGVI